MGKLTRHVLAFICSTCYSAFLPFALYCAWVIPRAKSAADLGGPLNFVIIPLMGGVAGGLISLVAFLPLALLAENFNFSNWFRIAGIIATLLLAVVLVELFLPFMPNRFIAFSTCGGLYLIGGFFVYLSTLFVCRKIIP